LTGPWGWITLLSTSQFAGGSHATPVHSLFPHCLFSIFLRCHGIDCPEKAQPFGTKAKQFTPAMEAGIADHVWSVEEIAGLLDKTSQP
jgi:hypothetical protein